MCGNTLTLAALTLLTLLLGSNLTLAFLHAQNPQQDVQALLSSDDTVAAEAKAKALKDAQEKQAAKQAATAQGVDDDAEE